MAKISLGVIFIGCVELLVKQLLHVLSFWIFLVRILVDHVTQMEEKCRRLRGLASTTCAGIFSLRRHCLGNGLPWGGNAIMARAAGEVEGHHPIIFDAPREIC